MGRRPNYCVVRRGSVDSGPSRRDATHISPGGSQAVVPGVARAAGAIYLRRTYYRTPFRLCRLYFADCLGLNYRPVCNES